MYIPESNAVALFAVKFCTRLNSFNILNNNSQVDEEFISIILIFQNQLFVL
ncbi:hypothetical protein HOF65_07905 [bacterium]|nr:hypothetical protein [bacterium]MBT3853815.1 hypothetical protein [bacterium]MBT4633629.1 hypothetical protein [bacterium]MBT5492694.1 hypothetical protein [bacterium]MBT6779383.1 hypothetical protein [bacterium]